MDLLSIRKKCKNRKNKCPVTGASFLFRLLSARDENTISGISFHNISNLWLKNENETWNVFGFRSLSIDKIYKKKQENSDETKWHWHKGESNAFDMCTRKIQPMLKFLIAHFNSIKKSAVLIHPIFPYKVMNMKRNRCILEHLRRSFSLECDKHTAVICECVLVCMRMTYDFACCSNKLYDIHRYGMANASGS